MPPQYAAPLPAADSGEGFAAGRVGPIGPDGPEPIPGRGEPVAPPPRVVGGMTGRFAATDPRVPADTRFPNPAGYHITPNAMGPRVMPPRPASTNANVPTPTAPVASSAVAPTTGKPGSLVSLPDGQTGMVLPDGQVVPFVSREELRETPPPKLPVAVEATPETPKAASKIDNEALQKYLMNRAGQK